MELIQLEMVAYLAAHETEEKPWRCVLCEELTPISDRFIRLHLATEHFRGNVVALKQEDGALFLYPLNPQKEKEATQ